MAVHECERQTMSTPTTPQAALVLSDDEIIAAMNDLDYGRHCCNTYWPQRFARAIESAILAKLQAAPQAAQWANADTGVYGQEYQGQQAAQGVGEVVAWEVKTGSKNMILSQQEFTARSFDTGVFKALVYAHPAPSPAVAVPMTKVLTEHSGCGQGAQTDSLTVRLHPGDKVVLHMGPYSAALATQQAQTKGERE
jgi:hypothetical protein